MNQLFAIFGMPSYVHTDRAATFLSQDLLSFFRRRGIVCSRIFVYNAPANGQCERYNGVIPLEYISPPLPEIFMSK